MGFRDTTTLVLLTHLWINYGGIDDVMLADNLKRIKTPWSPLTPIEKLFYQLKTCMSFATKGGYHTTQAITVRMDISIIKNNVLLSLDSK